MIKRLISGLKLALTLTLTLALPALAAGDKASAKTERQESILFIGNSYTYVNDLPGMLRDLLRAGKHPMDIDSYTRGATALSAFFDDPSLSGGKNKLAKGDFTWVILQDQSQTPAMRPEATRRYVKLWSELARERKTKPVLFLTWAHATPMRGKPALIADMQDKTSRTYCRCALENDIAVAPVGEAWRAWYAKNPDKPLHCPDLSHANVLGTYMAACVFYTTLTGESPIGLPAPRGVSRQLAKSIQKTAYATTRRFSPQSCIERLDAAAAKRPDAAAARALLTPGVTVRQVREALGNPSYINKQGDTVVYQFQLRDDGELCIYCREGKAYSATIRDGSRGGADIIPLDTP